MTFMRKLGSPLVCAECATESDELAAGWRASYGGELEEDDEKELVLLCPSCAEREFGPFGWGLD
jgi:hypothetical protein